MPSKKHTFLRVPYQTHALDRLQTLGLPERPQKVCERRQRGVTDLILLHQELVDFELPEPLGWPAVREASTNDPHWCIAQPFAFVGEDAQRGPSAQAMRRQQMLQFWRDTGKFRLPTDPGGAPDQPTRPCQVSFGKSSAEGSLSACRGPKVRVPRPTAAMACFAWCNGTLSERTLARASLGHVRFEVPPLEVSASAKTVNLNGTRRTKRTSVSR